MDIPSLTLRETVAILTYKEALSPSTFRMLSEWLDCYKNIPPSEQHLNESSFSLRARHSKAASTLYLYYFQIILLNHYTTYEQSNIIRHILCYMNTLPKALILESKTYLTPVSSLCIPVHVSSS
jgi:hypothetical protein